MNIISDSLIFIWKNTTPANIISGIVFTFLVKPTIDFLLKKENADSIEKLPRRNFETIFFIIGFFISLLAFGLFIILYILKTNYFEPLLSQESLNFESIFILFLIGYLTIWVIFLYEKLRFILNKKFSFDKFLLSSFYLLTIPSFIFIILFHLKVTVEMGKGYSMQEIDHMNNEFRDYLILFAKVIGISTITHLPHPQLKKLRIKIPVRKQCEDIPMFFLEIQYYMLCIREFKDVDTCKKLEYPAGGRTLRGFSFLIRDGFIFFY